MKVTTGVTAPGPADRERLRVGMERCAMADGGAMNTANTEAVAEAVQPPALRRRLLSRGDLSRGARLPDPRSAHRDDVRAELEHGRIGRARADRRAERAGRRDMRSLAWTLLMVACAVAVYVADWIGRAG